MRSVRLLNGARATRRFPSSTLLFYVHECVDSELARLPESFNAELLNVISSHYDLGTEFPKQLYTDLDLTLQQLNFPKRVLLSMFSSRASFNRLCT